MMDTELSEKNKRGRKPIQVTWPEGDFTAQEFLKLNSGRMSRASAHSKINKAVEYGSVNLIRKENPAIGRPINIYRVSVKPS